MSALTDPTAVLFRLVDDTPGSGLSEVDSYALLAGLLNPMRATSGVLTASAAAVRGTGGMVALVPSEEDAARLAVEDGEKPNELHLTLAFLGDDVTGLDAEVHDAIVDVARRYASRPVVANAFAVNIFNPGKVDADGSPGSCVVLGVGNDETGQLANLRSNVVSALGGLGGFDLPEQHTPWVPHVTLAYTDDFTRFTSEGLQRVGPITFDRIRVAIGDDITDVPLGARVGASEGGDDVPWKVVPRDGKFCVVKKDSGDTVACHDSEDSATKQLRALYANEEYGLRLAIEAAGITLEAARERDVNIPGGPGHQLREHWVRGPGAAEIRWGTDGSFDRCVRKLGKYVRDPQGLCAEYHKAATGEWPAEKGVESVGDVTTFADIGTTAESQAEECPPGHHRMPDGTCMSDSDMYDYVLRAEFGSSLETFHATHNQQDHNPFKGMKDVTPAQFEKTKQNLRSPGDSTRKIKPRSADDVEREVAERRSNDYDEDELTPEEERERDRRRIDTAATRPPKDEPWEGTLVVEGVESGDSRLFNMGSLDWADLPMPLMYQPANVGGHNASIMVGEIQNAARSKNVIKGWGTVYGEALAGEHGPMIRKMMAEDGPGGVSVDVDKVKDAEVELIYPEAAADGSGGIFAKPELTVFNRGRIRGATLVAFPAFVEAKLTLTGENTVTASAGDDCGCEDGSDVDPLVASAHTITLPDLPPAHWFNEPTDVKITGALTITDEGRVYGIVAPADTTHRNRPVKVPRSLDFSRFHKGETVVEGGKRVITGVITADCGHAATSNYGSLNNRLDHYDNSCSVLANVRVGYGRDGHIWVAGALNPGAKPHQVAQALGCALSLDAQPHPDKPGTREFIAAHLVPVPGFPLARIAASVAYQDGVLAASSVPIVRASARYVEYPFTTHVVTLAKQALTARLGLDPGTIKKNLSERLGI